MATETQRPNGELSDSGLVASDYTDHDEDPDVSSVTINATGNNTNTEYGVDFPTPTGSPTVGANLQEFRVGVEEFDSGQSGTPQARIELWENGSLIRAGTDTNVSTYAVLSFKWNANELATADGSLVQMKVIGTKSGGGPGARNTVRIGHMEWDVDYSSSPFYTQSAFRGYLDSATTAGALTTIAAQDVNWSQAGSVPFHIRFEIDNSGGGESAKQFRAYRQINAGGWSNITNTSTGIKMQPTNDCTSANGATGVGNILTTATSTFQDSIYVNNTGVITVDTDANSHIEYQICVELVPADLTSGDTVKVKVVNASDSSDIDAYTVTLTITYVSVVEGVGSASGSTVVISTSIVTAASPGSSAGAATVTSVGAPLFSGIGAADGVATVAGGGASISGSVGDTAGIATVAATSISTFSATGSSIGVATVAGTSIVTKASVGASNGIAVVAGVSISTSASIGDISGLATTLAIGEEITGGTIESGVGASIGISIVTSVGKSTYSADGAAAGTVTVNGVGQSTYSAVGSTVGIAVIASVGISVFSTDGSTAGTTVVSGIGISINSAAGAVSGTTTVVAVSASTKASVGDTTGTSVVNGVYSIPGAANGNLSIHMRRRRR
jgi:hypothetical protein